MENDSRSTATPTQSRRDADLSVVVVTRNEEANIEKVLESVLSAVEGVGDVKVFLIDSCSRDRTVELASAFPIGIVIYRGRFYSAAAGRSIGLSVSSGEFILFVDGDCMLIAAWLSEALEHLMNNPDIGAIAGRLENLSRESARDFGDEAASVRSSYNVDRANGEASGLTSSVEVGGNALYRRKALQEIGGFNPYLRGCEDTDCSIRLRGAGYRIAQTHTSMGVHLRSHEMTTNEVFRRAGRGFLLARGQLLRANLFKPGLLVHFLRRFMPYVLASLWILFGIVSLAVIPVAASAVPALIWLFVCVVALGVHLIIARCPARTLYTLVNVLVGGIELLRGLFIPLGDPQAFSPDLDWVKGKGPETDLH